MTLHACTTCGTVTDDGEPNDLPPLPANLTSRGGTPDLQRDELLHIISQHIDRHPRSQQTRIGPSEIGTPCTRRLGYKLLGISERDTDPAWRPAVGTAVHDWLEQALRAFNDQYAYDRFYVEERVTVGQIGDTEISGRTDCYDRVTATVVDWKVVGPSSLKSHKAHGHPGRQYRAQCHLYGRGWQQAGNPVDHVGILFLPSSGELRDAWYWSEPYDEQIALDALARANTVHDLLTAAGTFALEHLPTSAEAYCHFCPWFRPGSTDLAQGCPGDTASAVKHDAPATLAAALT